MREKAFGPVRFLPGPNKGKYPACHSVFVEGAGVLIDPASDRERLSALAGEGGVRLLLLSHWHEDHFAHWDLFRDVPVWLAEEDMPPLQNIEVFLDWYGMIWPGDERLRETWAEIIRRDFHYRKVTPDRPLQGGEVLSLGETTMEVIRAPGHTPGHLAFYFREQGVLFLGDYDLTAFGPYYGDPASSIEDTVSTVEALRRIPARVWMTGHGTGLFEEEPGGLWDRYLGVIGERDGKILEYVARPRTLEEILGQWFVYLKPREPLDFYRFTERAQIVKHLEKLTREGRVEREGERYVGVK
jgi:glyoxylase-like metal-dependent hydrolase (beta-lactamase superfamily II)